MELKTLYCIVSMFDVNQDIYLGNDDDSKSIIWHCSCATTQLETVLIDLAKNISEVHRVRLFGDKSFLEPIVEKLKENNIEVEIN